MSLRALYFSCKDCGDFAFRWLWLLRFRINLKVNRIRKVHLAQPAEIENQVSASKEQRSTFVSLSGKTANTRNIYGMLLRKSIKVNTVEEGTVEGTLAVLKQATVLTALAWLLIAKEPIHCIHLKWTCTSKDIMTNTTTSGHLQWNERSKLFWNQKMRWKKYAVCVMLSDEIVGRLKKGGSGCFTKTVFYLLRAEEKGSCTPIVKGNAVNLADGKGMQVPCTLHFEGTTKFIYVLRQPLQKNN